MKKNKVFSFWCPIEITKGKNKSGKEIMKLGGIASTSDKDTDGEFLDPTGFDIDHFLQNGVINWHHQSKTSPASIIGEPSKAEITKKGLYIETELYSSSDVAKEVYKLAQTLKKDSTSRKLGFSIEGKVLERDEENPLIVKKAMITGCAITHMPKNPKTFADIIKGQVDDEEEDTEKDMDTEAGRPMIKESIDGGNKRKTKKKLEKAQKVELFEKIFEAVPGIDIEKSKKIYQLITKINEMKKSKTISDDQIEKAFETIGLSSETFIEKGKKTKEKEEEEEEDEEEEVTKGETETETVTEKKKTETVEKGQPAETLEKKEEKEGVLTRIEKAITASSERSETLIKAMGTILKKSLDETEFIKSELVETKNELIKAQEQIEALGGTSAGRKTVTTTSYKEKESFQKSQEAEQLAGKNVVKTSERTKVLDILDACTFEKGYDPEFAKAMTGFEAGSPLSGNVINRLKIEKGIHIV